MTMLRIAASWSALIVMGLASSLVGGERAAGPAKQGAVGAPLEYAGPGREIPDPAVTEVRIGYFGPSEPAHADGGDAWRAAQLAIDEANRQGGYRGKPFRLVAGWSDDPWTAGARHVTEMVFVDKVWALIGGIDGPSAPLAGQVTAKANLALVSPVSTDRTANAAFVPWMFSLLPGDDVLAPLEAERIALEPGAGALVVISGDDHDSRVFWARLTAALAKRKIVARSHFVYASAPGDPGPVVSRAIAARPGALVVLAAPAASARLVVALRDAGYAGRIFGGPWMGRRAFVEKAGRAAEDVVFPLLYVAKDGAEKKFAAEFTARYKCPPDYAAAGTYDAVTLVVAAVRKAGLNRARIHDALRGLSGWKGGLGEVRWDRLGGNTRPVTLGAIRDGHAVPLLK
jgi:branched-chain amino acid transport system substrate-binding protein